MILELKDLNYEWLIEVSFTRKSGFRLHYLAILTQTWNNKVEGMIVELKLVDKKKVDFGRSIL